jgi:Domain of unknown function (DUF4333)
VRRARICSGLAVAATCAVLGCGATVVDSEAVEASIAEAATGDAGVRVKSVVCPKDPPARMGEKFTCVVTGTDDTKGDAVATQLDNRGGVSVSVPFVHTPNAEETIAFELEQAGEAAKVRCPEIVVKKAGGTFRCRATGAKRTRTVRATMTDAKGNFRVELPGPGR